jgi:hypothetical protein
MGEMVAVVLARAYFGFGLKMPSRARVTMGCRGCGAGGGVGGCADGDEAEMLWTGASGWLGDELERGKAERGEVCGVGGVVALGDVLRGGAWPFGGTCAWSCGVVACGAGTGWHGACGWTGATSSASSASLSVGVVCRLVGEGRETGRRPRRR